MWRHPAALSSASEEIFIGASVTGVLKEIAVKEGDRVRRGDVLARIENDDLAASLGQAIAQVRLQEAELQRVMNGAQAAERREASAGVEAAEAVEKNAKAEFERERMLASASIASRVTLEQAQTQFEVAHQKYQEAVEKYNLVNDPTRDEDVAIAQAKLDAARAARDAAQAMLDKSVIQSPIDGTVLRVFRHPGELISVFMNEPVLSMGDISTLNVRAEIDEADIARVKPGLPVYVTAEAYGQQRFTGHVLRLGEVLGKKSLVTNEPGERTDSNVLEALVQLDAPNPLRPGLRSSTRSSCGPKAMRQGNRKHRSLPCRYYSKITRKSPVNLCA